MRSKKSYSIHSNKSYILSKKPLFTRQRSSKAIPHRFQMYILFCQKRSICAQKSPVPYTQISRIYSQKSPYLHLNGARRQSHTASRCRFCQKRSICAQKSPIPYTPISPIYSRKSPYLHLHGARK